MNEAYAQSSAGHGRHIGARMEAVSDRPERALEGLERRVRNSLDNLEHLTRRLGGEADRLRSEGQPAEGTALLRGEAIRAEGNIATLYTQAERLENAVKRLENEVNRFETI